MFYIIPFFLPNRGHPSIPCSSLNSLTNSLMACRTEAPEDVSRRLVEEIKFLRAALCAVLSAVPALYQDHDPTTVYHKLFDDCIDYKEAGITKHQLTEWWSYHQKADADRKAREAEVERIKKLRHDAKVKIINTLTVEEMKVLGLTSHE